MSRGHPFENAQWMWPHYALYDLHNAYALFRKSFDLQQVPARAPLFITADQAYHLFINGVFVGRGPARGFQDTWPYDEIDLSPFLREGANVLSIRAHNPGHGTFSYISQTAAGVLVFARWPVGESTLELKSDASWRATEQRSVKSDTAQASWQLFHQEHVDLQHEPLGWKDAGFDDSGWTISLLNTPTSPPWHSLEARDIPMLREEARSPLTLLARSQGKSQPNFRNVRDVVRLAVAEGLEHLAGDESAWKDGTLSVPSASEDEYVSFVLDCGRVFVGNLELRVEGARGGEVVDALFGEITREDDARAPTQTPVHEPDGACNLALGARLLCRAGENAHTFFHPYGFRFLCLRVRGATEPLRLTPTVHTIGYPLGRDGAFKSSDELLCEIWNACAHTQGLCSLDAYVDTPWREQAQWWGDARVQAWNTFHLGDDARLLRRGIRQIGHQQLPNGLTYGHAPTIAHTCVLPDFTLIWMLTQWDYFFQTASLEAFETHWAQTRRALDYFRAQIDPATGLVQSDPRYWLFLDWTGLPKDGSSTVLNAWLVLALERLAALHDASGTRDEAQELKVWASAGRAALQELLTGEGLLRDGRDENAAPFETTSIHAQTLGLMLGLDGLDERRALDEVLLPFIALEALPDANATIRPSAYWATYVFTELSKRGYGREVVRFIRRFWEPMARFGSTWEGFASDGGSRSHAWSAHPLYHFAQTIGGLSQTAPRWSKVRFAPVFEGEFGGVTIPTPHGTLRSHWRRHSDRVNVELDVPGAVAVDVELPGVQTHLEARGEAHSAAWSVQVASSEAQRS